MTRPRFQFFCFLIQVCLRCTKSNKTEQNETNISVNTQPFIPRKTRLLKSVEVPETPLHAKLYIPSTPNIDLYTVAHIIDCVCRKC